MQTNPNILGETLVEYIDMLMQMMKETDPERYKKIMEDNEKARKKRLAIEAREMKENTIELTQE